MAELKETVKNKKEECEKKFEEIKGKRIKLVDDFKKVQTTFQTQLNELDTELVKLQGEFRAFESLEGKPIVAKSA